PGACTGGSGKSSRELCQRQPSARRGILRTETETTGFTAGISYQNTLGPAFKCNRRRGKMCPWPLPSTPAVLRCTRRSASAVPPRIAATKAFLEQKFHLAVEVCCSRAGNPRWRDDDLTSNVFRSNARVDTLAPCVGIVASRGLAR